jgi:1-deoxy-D-xylulose-5-phosphate reductoisomerase
MKRVVILGATGSIGTQALEICAAHDDLCVVGVAAGRAVEALASAAAGHPLEAAGIADASCADAARDALGVPVLAGPDAAARLVAETAPDVVLNAIVGAAGLDASLAALAAGADLALANKESLVAGGPLVLDALARGGGRLLPVDSEHSALLQCLAASSPEAVEGVVVTASGGPFRGLRREDLRDVTPADALRHPTWSMGAKITIDSATLMNKGLEVIEAHFLFALPYDRVEVVVHPQSIVHGLVRFRDGALIAHLGEPDMRVPISYALTYPARAGTPASQLDLARAFALQFEPPDVETFRCLALARDAGEAGGTAPCILNAANEEAVAAFLAGRAGFLDIDALVAGALDAVPVEPADDLAVVRAADAAARAAVHDRLGAVA